MCLLLISYKNHPVYKIIVAANRDEFYNRPAEPAKFWEEKPFLLAGKDLMGGGTWLGITKTARFAAITNYREPNGFDKSKPTRGKLVTNFLENKYTAKEYSKELIATAESYNGYNLIFWDGTELLYFSNKTKSVKKLKPGIYALSNHLLDTPWPKVEKSKENFIASINKKDLSTGDLFNILSDKSIPPDELLPDTGAGIEIERAVSPVFVSTPFYGTRSSTVILIDRQNNTTFIEKSLTTDQSNWHTSAFHFSLENSPAI